MILRTFAAAVLALSVVQSQAPPTPPTSPFAAAAIRRDPPAGQGTPVALTFAWPIGMTATIEVERSKTTLTPEGRKATSAAMRYRMRVSDHRDGRLIEYDKFEPIGMQLAAPEQAAFVDLLSTLMPSLVVAGNGAFVRVGDLTAIRATIRQILDVAKKQAPAGSVRRTCSPFSTTSLPTKCSRGWPPANGTRSSARSSGSKAKWARCSSTTRRNRRPSCPT